MKLIIILLLFFQNTAFGGFPQGNHEKMHKDALQFKSILRMITASNVDPSLVATPGNPGDIIMSSGFSYIKKDIGTTTNWEPFVDGLVDLTSEVTGILPVANGGTNSSTALTNDNIMYSQGGSIVESPVSLDSSGNIVTAGEITVLNGGAGQLDVGSSIATNTTNIGLNTTAIGTNATNIGLNTTAIGVNAGAIAAMELQTVYDVSADGEIVLDSTRTSFELRDNLVPIAAPLFEVLSNDSLTTYFSTSAAQNTSISLDINGRLETASTTEASLPCPVMTEVQRDAVAAPVAGDCVYNSDTNVLNFYDGTVWGAIDLEGGLPLMAKGSIVTSDGASNGEFTACADGEKLEWDSAEASGVKCVTAAASVPNYVFATGNVGANQLNNPGTTPVVFPNMSLSITSTGNPIRVEVLAIVGATFQSVLAISGTFSCQFHIFRDGVRLASTLADSVAPADFVKIVDVIGAGTYTYDLRASDSGTANCNAQSVTLLATEIK